VFIISIFITKFDHNPLINSYSWLYYNFPLFDLYRDAQKFYFWTLLSYIILLSLILKYIINIKIRNVILFFIFIIFLFNSYPFFLHKVKVTFDKKTISKPYLLVNNYISKDQDNFKVLWVPFW